jgi:hypothetical protein
MNGTTVVIKYFIHGSRTLLQNLTNLLKIDVIFLDRLAHPFWQHFEEDTKRTRKKERGKEKEKIRIKKEETVLFFIWHHSLTHSLIVVSPSHLLLLVFVCSFIVMIFSSPSFATLL